MDNEYFIKRCATAGIYWDEDFITMTCDSLEVFKNFCKELISYTTLRDIELQDSYNLIPYFYYYWILSIPEYRQNRQANRSPSTPEDMLGYEVQSLFRAMVGYYDAWNYVSLNINYVLFALVDLMDVSKEFKTYLSNCLNCDESVLGIYPDQYIKEINGTIEYPLKNKVRDLK